MVVRSIAFHRHIMVRYVLHNEIDFKKWDECIDNSCYPIIYAYSWYLDTVSPGWHALIEGDYDSVFPLTWKKKFGIHYLAQPLFAQQLGIFSKKELTQGKNLIFLNAIPSKYVHFNISLNPTNTYRDTLKYKYVNKRTYYVSLNNDYSRIFEAYANDTKRILKNFAKNKLTIKDIQAKQVIDLYKNNVWHKTPDVTLHDFETVEKLVKITTLKKDCLILGAFTNEGVLCAGMIFFKSNNKIMFTFGGCNETGRQKGGMRFIIDCVFRNNCNNNLIFDFEGSSIKSIEYFFKSFGSVKLEFPNIIYSNSYFLRKAISIKQNINQFIHQKKGLLSKSID